MQPCDWHRIETDEALQRLGSSATGLTKADAQQRLAEHGPNVIPQKTAPFPAGHAAVAVC